MIIHFQPRIDSHKTPPLGLATLLHPVFALHKIRPSVVMIKIICAWNQNPPEQSLEMEFIGEDSFVWRLLQITPIISDPDLFYTLSTFHKHFARSSIQCNCICDISIQRKKPKPESESFPVELFKPNIHHFERVFREA